MVLGDVGDDRLDALVVVAEVAQRPGHRLVDEAHRAATHEPLELHQPEVGFDPGRVAVHEEPDGARGREHARLGVADPDDTGPFAGVVPRGAGRLEDAARRELLVDAGDGVAMEVEHPQHVVAVVREALEGPHPRREPGRRAVGLTRHERGDRGGDGAPTVGVVGQAERHQQGTEVRVADAELTEPAAGLGDPGRRVVGVADEDLLGGEQDPHRVGEAVDIEAVHVLAEGQEPHQVERRQIAGTVVEMHVFTAVAHHEAIDDVGVIAWLGKVVGELDSGVDARAQAGGRVGRVEARGRDDVAQLRRLRAQLEPDVRGVPSNRRAGDTEIPARAAAVLPPLAIEAGPHSRPRRLLGIDPGGDAERGQESLDPAEEVDRDRAESDIGTLRGVDADTSVRIEKASQECRSDLGRSLVDRPRHGL